jgi:hypothetical protein
MNVDPKRWQMVIDNPEIRDGYETGIFVRAKLPNGKIDAVDIAFLDKDSLLKWLRSRGGHNEFAEEVVLVLLGHLDELETR